MLTIIKSWNIRKDKKRYNRVILPQGLLGLKTILVCLFCKLTEIWLKIIHQLKEMFYIHKKASSTDSDFLFMHQETTKRN